MSNAFTSYEQVNQWYQRVRDPAKGRPMMQWGRVIKAPDGAFEFFVYKNYNPDPFARLTPDNIITFLYTGLKFRDFSGTLIPAMNRWLPFVSLRVGRGRYNILHNKGLSLSEHWWRAVKERGVEMYPGLQFNISTGECLNAKVLTAEVNPGKRKEWLRMLRKYKRNIKVRARLGVYDSMIVRAEKRNRPPDWMSDEWKLILYNAIKTGDIPEKLSEALVAHAMSRRWYGTLISAQEVVDANESVCSMMSRDMRRMFGVLKEIIHE